VKCPLDRVAEHEAGIGIRGQGAGPVIVPLSAHSYSRVRELRGRVRFEVADGEPFLDQGFIQWFRTLT